MDPNNWDLDAVVRGCCFAGSTTVSAMDPFVSMQSSSFINEQPSLHRGEEDEAMFMSFPYLSESRFELDDLYKPFIFGNFSQPSPPPPQQEHQQPRLQFLSSMASHQTQQPMREIHHRPVSQAPKSKRRKNQLKKVVCQIPAEGVSPDMWAWRKYGQKPIKGSPYPRGYYRCSSSKGCPARKQVERSVSNAGMLVVTYTGEHNHPIPTHRNSLAGSTRQKLPPPPPSSSTNTSSSPPSTSDAAGLSPITPLTASMEDELLQSWRCKSEGDDDYDELMAIGGVDLVGDEDSMFLELEKNFLEDGVDGIAQHFR